jgi:hypothetical protein
MNPRVARVLIGLYPHAWRERYGAEFEAFLADGSTGFRETLNVIGSALHEHIFPTRGANMNQPAYSFGALVRCPSALIPVVMSLTALALVLGHILLYGHAREADEGAAAHLWQLLMAGQLPVLIFFAVKWLPRAPRQSLCVLGLQAGAVLASLAPVYYFNL